MVQKVKYYAGLFVLFAKYSLVEQMEYRINFLAGIAVECGYMLIKLMYAVLIYKAGVEINGVSADEMLMCIGTYIMMTGLFMAIYPNFCSIPAYVRDGSLDMLLCKPINTQFIVTLRKIDFGMPIPNVVCGIILIVHGWNGAGIPVTILGILGFALYCIVGFSLTYCMFLIPELLSFWWISVTGVHQLSEAIRDFDNMPMNVYSKRVQWFGIFLIPVFVITNFPTLFVKGKLTMAMAIWGIISAVLMFIVQKIVWRRAMRHYTSASC